MSSMSCSIIVAWHENRDPSSIASGEHSPNFNTLTLILQVANFANTKSCKKPQKSLRLCALGKISLSIRRVEMSTSSIHLNFFDLNINPITLLKDIMPYFNKLIHDCG